MFNYECERCGVAFDVGCRECQEQSCIRPAKPKKLHVIDPIKSRLQSIKYRAMKKGLTIDLTLEYLADLLELPCVYCGSFDRIQVDRKNPTEGYTRANVAPACRRCNTIKNNVVSYDEMVFIAKYLGWRKYE